MIPIELHHSIFKSNNAKGNNSSNTKVLRQIMPQQKRPIKLQVAQKNLLHGLSIKVQAGHGRRLSTSWSSSSTSWWSSTGWPERRRHSFNFKISLTGSSDSHVSDGRCIHYTASRTLCHFPHAFFSRMAQD